MMISFDMTTIEMSIELVYEINWMIKKDFDTDFKENIFSTIFEQSIRNSLIFPVK